MTSAVGQELSSAGKYSPAAKVLEAARNIGTDSPRLQSSLLQALGTLLIISYIIVVRIVQHKYMYMHQKCNKNGEFSPSHFWPKTMYYIV